MSRATRARVSASASMLCVFGIAACGPSAIPLNGSAPAEGLATIRETDGFIVDEDGHVEISRVDGCVVQTHALVVQTNALRARRHHFDSSPFRLVAISTRQFFKSAERKFAAC